MWTATTFVSSVKIILKPFKPPKPIRLPLQLFFFIKALMCAGRNLSVVIKVKK